MREFKFRGFHTNDKTMLDPVTINELVVLNGGYGLSDGLILMQYTGLKDKNGKEIYEGDIVQHENGSITKIIWDEEFSCFRPDGWDKETPKVFIHEYTNGEYIEVEFDVEDMWSIIDDGRSEVIGNIYENPDKTL